MNMLDTQTVKDIGIGNDLSTLTLITLKLRGVARGLGAVLLNVEVPSLVTMKTRVPQQFYIVSNIR